MKKLTTLLALVAVSALAQDNAVVQTGTPSQLEAINGKKMQVMLQSLENETITFQPYKSQKNISVQIDKIKHLKFFLKYDAEAVEVAFNNGNYAEVLTILNPLMEPFEAYMPIDNTLRPAFIMQMKAHYALGNFPTVRKSADLLIASPVNPGVVMQGQVYKALSLLAEGDVKSSEKLCETLDSEVVKLYLQACTQRTQGQPKDAMQTVVEIIAEHENDVDWLAPTELLSARLYLDLGMTNSALNTARQVKNMYAGTHISADAEKLYTQLGGEDTAD